MVGGIYLLFLANLPWLLALLPGFVADEGTPHIAFWQLYFLTTPHRWITLFLVALDPDRREGRPGRFLALALLGLLAIAGTKLATPTPIFTKLEDSIVAEELARLESGG